MQVQSFIETIYHWLTQRGATMFVSKESIMNFINFWLNDIYSFEWRGWSFMYKDNEDIVIPWTHTDTSYLHTTSFPIYRIINIYDNKIQSLIETSKFKQTKLNITSDWEIFYLPFTTALNIYNNIDWYKLAYLWWFIPVNANEDYLPIPDAFVHALYDFVMSYILPVYAQYWEQRENVSYQKWMAKLNELKKADDIQFSKITYNIK